MRKSINYLSPSQFNLSDHKSHHSHICSNYTTFLYANKVFHEDSESILKDTFVSKREDYEYMQK
jgi:hypothetical protein